MKQQRVIALGFFDGVHLGHGQLLRRCRQAAEKLGCKAAALTFDVHPDTLVAGDPVPLLSSVADRARIMRELYGVQEVLPLHFDRALMDMPWEDFLQRVLVERYGAAHLVCGHDFRFGAKGRGTAERLAAACARLGLGCDVIPAYRLEGRVVSSTYIRRLLEKGDLDGARRFLGHPYLLSGAVVPGAGLGRTMDVPTANLAPPPGVLLPVRGVYACRARVPAGTFLAVTNVGLRPTVDGRTLTVEPWLLDFNGDLYGQAVTLEFWSYLRGERKFESLEALRQEILRNAQQTRAYFQSLDSGPAPAPTDFGRIL